MAIKTFKRKEVKFLLNMNQFNELLKVIDLYMEPDKYCVGGKEYGIYNIYYDTPDSFLIRESLAKPYYKEKLRVRSYFSPAGPDDKVYVEIKKKIGGIVTKRRLSMTRKEAEIYLKTGIRPITEKYLDNQVLDEIDIFRNNYPISPAQYISYQRMAFFGKDNKDFRLTFDRNITDRRYDLSLGNESYGRQIIKADQRLMEIKITDSIPLWLSEALSQLGIYKTSFSKYGRAYRSFVKDNILNEKGVNIYA
ncbi:MAG: polyphosphate polymerase domain-containing protein [Ruminococcus sp.]|nr:polyphosphate polymerase domain-containing protein [Ruminococcus sp.]